MSELNQGFGVEAETEGQRVARLRARAVAAVERESDDAMLQRFMAEERLARLPADDTKLPVDTQGFPQDYTKVEIFKGQNKFDLAYVPLGINGYTIKVPRGETVILPTCFIEGPLAHAIEEITIQSQGGLITRPAPRFPYNIKGKATIEEYQAYQAQQRAKAERQLGQAAVA